MLRQYAERHVLIEGFTDDRGSEESNLALSTRRAHAFLKALLAAAVATERMELRAHSEAFPVTANASAEGRPQNCRGEVPFSDGQRRSAAGPR